MQRGVFLRVERGVLGQHDVDGPGSVAQFEREMMLERQREGVAKAKAEGQYKRRKPIAPELRDTVLRLASLGTTKVSITRQLNLGEVTVYRILAAAKTAESGRDRRGENVHPIRFA
jgi:DNA invertase Pin-like site-specific DNA recombinase